MYGKQERLLKGVTFAIALGFGGALIAALAGLDDSPHSNVEFNAGLAPSNSPTQSSSASGELLWHRSRRTRSMR